MATDDDTLDRLAADARAVLDANWLGASTLPSRTLYPHQWNWDSAFIAMGRSWSDEPRAQQELRSLFRAQWADGRVPHIVFNPSVGEDAYFPGPAFWQSSRRSAQAPRDVETSGITQPPVHARAALEMHRHATDVEASTAFLRWLYPRLVAEHDYLDGRRRPGGSSLPVFMHPWESGLDNSPAWDRDLADMVIPPGSIPPYVRHDLDHANAADRPTNEAYDRFVFLAARYRDAGYDDDRLLDQVPFLVAGPLFNAIHLWSTHALAEIAEIVGADPVPHREDARRIHDAMLADLWDPETKRFGALDVIEHELSIEDTIISFAPLLDPDLPKAQLDSIMADLRSAHFHPGPADRVRGAELRPARRATSTSGATGGARSGSTPTGCCGWASASTARTPRPRRSSSAACASSRGPASTSTSIRSTARRSAPTASAGRRR